MSVRTGKPIVHRPIEKKNIRKGRTVRIKSKEWYDNFKNRNGSIVCGLEVFTPDMERFLGSDLTIGEVVGGGALFSVEETVYWFTPEMVERLIDD